MAALEMFPDEGEILVCPGVDPGIVRPPTLHPEAGDADHAPPLPSMISQERSARVSVAGVSSSSPGTDLVVPDVDVEVLVGGGAELPADHRDRGLPQPGLGRSVGLSGAPANHHRVLAGRTSELRQQVMSNVVVWQAHRGDRLNTVVNGTFRDRSRIVWIG